jgi:phenylalanyl-tRNA synthetase beta subunit
MVRKTKGECQMHTHYKNDEEEIRKNARLLLFEIGKIVFDHWKAERQPIPLGTLYAALSAKGCSMQQFNGIIQSMDNTHCFKITSCTIEPSKKFKSILNRAIIH